MRIILSKRFLKYFLISFSVYLAVLLIQFLCRYADDIFSKGFPASEIAIIIMHTSLSLFGVSLLFGFLIASIFSFRYYSKRNVIRFKSELLKGSLLVMSMSILFFVFNNWILPKSTLEMRSLLYEMRATAPGEKIQRVDRSLFTDYHSMMTIKKINYKIDTFNINIEKYKHQCDSALSLLPDSVARDSYDRLRLADYGIGFNSTDITTKSERDIRYTSNYLRSYQNNLKRTIEQKQKYVKEKTTRIILPIELILLFVIGASFGFYYNDQKGFLLVILGLYTSMFFYRSEQLISQNMFGNFGGTMTSMIILLSITIVFLILGLNKERKNYAT